ncbi:unnamed protein product, partial [Closterium sp. NIES-54]
MKVARTSMIHAAAPHFLWSFAFYHPTSRRVLPSQDVTFDESAPFHRLFPYRTAPFPPPPLFLAPGPPPVDPLPPQGPTPSGVSQVDPLPGTEPVEVAVDSGAARGAASGGAVSRGAVSGGAEPEGAESGGAEPGGAESGGTEPEGVERGGAKSEGAESRGAEPRGIASAGGPAVELQELEALPVETLELEVAGALSLGGAGVTTGPGGTGGAGAAGRGGAHTRGTGAAWAGGVGGAGARDPGAGGIGAGGTVAGGAGARDPGVGGPRAGGGAGAGALELETLELEVLALGAGAGGPGAGGTVQRRPFFVAPLPLSLPPPDSVLRQALSLPSSTGLPPSLLSPPPHQSQPQLQPDSPLHAPSPYTEQTDSFIEHREPESRPASPVRVVRTGRHIPRPRPPPVPGTHVMALRPSSVPLRVPLPPSPTSSLPDIPDPESDLAHAASPTVPRLLATVVTDPSFESTAASALVAELVDFAAACRLDYATSLAAESESDCPPSVGGECALGTDILEDRQEDFECLASTVPHLVAMLLAPKRYPDAPDILTPRSYVEVPREWHDTLRTTLAALGFAPSIADPSLFLRTDTSLPPFYVLVYVDDTVFSTADTESLTLVKSELQKRHTFTDRGELRSYHGLQLTWDRARRTITLTQTHMVHQVLQRFGFRYSSPQPTPLPTGHLLSAPPSDESVEPSGPYPELVGCLMYLMTYTRLDLAYPLSILAHYGAPERHRPEHWEAAKRVLRYLCSTSGMGLVLGGRGPVVLTGHADSFWVDDLTTQRSSQGCTFSLNSGSVSWQSTRWSFVFSSSCDAEIYPGVMAAQELCWLTYLLTDLGERPRSSRVLCVDNKPMIALCQEHRLEHRMKHIALRYLLARELQHRCQLRLAYVATRANTADVFTKALQCGDH